MIRLDWLPCGRRHCGYYYYQYDGPWTHHLSFWWFSVSWKPLEAFLS